MTNKFAGALAAGALTVGILVGAAGTVLIQDATGPAMGMGDMTQMMEMMDGGMMDGGMMDGGTMDGGMMDGGMMDGASIAPAEHENHHGDDQ